MASVTIGAVHKYFGQTHIIKGVSVDIADEIVEVNNFSISDIIWG